MMCYLKRGEKVTKDLNQPLSTQNSSSFTLVPCKVFRNSPSNTGKNKM